jgi:hypothetical protein
MNSALLGPARTVAAGAAMLLISGCHRHGSIYPDQLPELSGVPPGKRVLIERRLGPDTEDDALGERTVAGSRYRSLYFDEVFITLMDGRRLKLEPPFTSFIWRHPLGHVLTIDEGTGPRSYWLREVIRVELTTFDSIRPAVVAMAATAGALLGLAFDASRPTREGGSLLPLLTFTALGAGIGLAISIPLTSDL